MRSAILKRREKIAKPVETEEPVRPADDPESDVPESKETLVSKLLDRLSGLKAKLIVPYLVLTLLTAMIGTFIVTRLVASSVRERFFNQLDAVSEIAVDGIVRKEQDHLADLRLMAFTEGVPEAFIEEDGTTLQDILWPLALNNEVEVVTTVNLDGQEIITLAQDPVSGRYGVYEDTDFSAYEIVNKVLSSDVDQLGDKYAGLLNTRFGPYLYTSAPVKDESNSLVGVIMVGTRLDTLLRAINEEAFAQILIVLDANGTLLASTYPYADEEREILELPPNNIPNVGDPETREFEVGDDSYQAKYSHLQVRKAPVGMLGVALRSNYVVSAEGISRNTFGFVFSLAALAVIIIGYLLSQSIAKPILKLRSVSKAVAEGDLNQRTGFKRSDEIGDLAAVFDLMTFRLRKRTAQAARLYAETLERNEELAKANARLQSAQQQLIQSEKLAATGQLTAGIVHDVKNPLAVIKGLAEELQEEVLLSTEATEQLKTIRDNANRANQIVTDLLKFAREATPVMKRQNICETVKTATRLTDYLARKGKVEVITEIPTDPVMVTYDSTQIEQVLVNLFQNAIQAMPNGGKININLNREEKGISLRVQDEGVGIPAENLSRIFDPFFTTKPEGEGTGLGLSVSYGIVTKHRGRIDVKSTPGKGSSFTIKLPYDQPLRRGKEG
jgi:signal transduction histidine kinase